MRNRNKAVYFGYIILASPILFVNWVLSRNHTVENYGLFDWMVYSVAVFIVAVSIYGLLSGKPFTALPLAVRILTLIDGILCILLTALMVFLMLMGAQLSKW